MASKKPSRETYELIPEFDAAILKVLPDEGSKVGFHVLGKQVKAIVKELSATAPVTSGQVTSRLRILEQGHKFVTAVTVMPVSNGRGWQRTAAGREFMEQFTTNGSGDQAGS